MTKFEELMNEVNDLLKENLTAENTESITKIKGKLDDLTKEHNLSVAENQKLKDKIVDVVKGTTFKETPKDPIDDSQPKSFEEASKEALDNILKNRKEN